MTAVWQDVPRSVATLVKEAAPVVRTLRKVLQHLPAAADPGYGYLYWHPDTKTVWAVLSDGDDQAKYNKYHNALKAVTGVKDVRVEAETGPHPRDEWVRIKRACDLGIVTSPFYKAAIDSPNALTTTIGGGLLGAGLGYGTGFLLEHLFPERYVQRGKLRRTLGLLGAGAGAVPGIWAASARARLRPGTEQAGNWWNLNSSVQPGEQMGWWRGFMQPKSTLPVDPGLQQEMNQYDRTRTNALPLAKAAEALAAYLPDEWLAKAADAFNPPLSAGGTGIPTVPLDAFGQAIWNDTRNWNAAQHNPYGSKSPWGTNEQPMGTPPAYAAAAAGLVSGIGAQYGNPSLLSPVHFMKGLATAGVDMATARVAGGVLGALGGLTPAAQNQLQDMGLWGGLIRGVVGSVFGR